MALTGVVIDTCVLVKASVRDTLYRAYVARLYQMHWTDNILIELRRNLSENNLTTDAGAERLVQLIRSVFADAEITDYQSLIPTMTNHPKDRHILAAAVVANAAFIVTENVRDFPEHALSDHGIEVLTPDDFLVLLAQRNRATMERIINEQARDTRNPPLTVDDVLTHLARDGVPRFVQMIRH